MDIRLVNVLFIEDNPGDALLIQMQLSNTPKIQYKVTHVDRFNNALKCLKKNNFDVVLLDLNLPDAMGLITIEQIHAESPDVPIVVLTGNDDDEVGIEAVQKGSQDYLIKGKVTGALLGQSICYAIERKKLLTQLEHSAKEIKTLRGLLPICAHCKKIRDDRGSWTEIETYISAKMQAQFTHGICPDCAVKLYGQSIEKKK